MKKGIATPVLFIIALVFANSASAQLLDDDTLIIGDNSFIRIFPGENAVIPIYLNNSVFYQGLTVPVEIFDADTFALDLDSLSMVNSIMYGKPEGKVPPTWDFIAPFENNQEWDDAIQCGVAGVVSFYGSDSLPPCTLATGYWIVGEMHLGIAADAAPRTMVIDTTAASWVSGGPKNDYVVVVGGLSYRTHVIPCTLQIGYHLFQDTLVIGSVIGYPGEQVVVPVYMKNTVASIGSWNIPLTFGDGSAPLVCDSIHYNTGEWNYSFISLLQIDNVNQNLGYGGVTFSPNLPGYHKVMELFITIDNDAAPQTIVVDTTRTAGYGSFTLNGSWVSIVQPGSIEIRGLLPNDSLKITDRYIHPGMHVSVPVRMRNSVDISQWEIPLTFGDGSAGIYLDSVSFIDGWSSSSIIDNIEQKCLIEGSAGTPKPPGDHLVATLWFTGISEGTYWIDTVSFDFDTRAIRRYGILSNDDWYVTRVKRGYLMVMIGVEEENSGTIIYQGVYPTITRAGFDIKITYMVPQNTDARITMYDVTGRKVKTIYQGKPRHALIDIAFNTKGLPAGVYFVVINGKDEAAKHKIIIY